MAKKKLRKEVENTTEQKLINGISAFFEKNLKTILISLAAVAIVVVAIVVIVGSSSKSSDSAQIKIAEMEEKYSELAASETPDWDSYEAELATMVKGSSYTSVKASYLLGLAHYDQEDYASAKDAFHKAYELNTKIYLAPIALVNEAACTEAMGDTTGALDLYNKVFDDYKESGVAAKALFNVARIYLQQGNTQLAGTVFVQVATDYPNSEYGKLAKNIANTL